MSGSGGGGFGGGGYEEPVACERLIVETPIASPKENVVRNLQVGDVLQVTLENQAGTTVIVLLFNGDKAGGIASSFTTKLRECIQQGTHYEATVTAKSDGQVQVRIRAVKR